MIADGRIPSEGFYETPRKALQVRRLEVAPALPTLHETHSVRLRSSYRLCYLQIHPVVPGTTGGAAAP